MFESSSIFGASDPLLPLQNACSICLVAARKYKCPGCEAKTCSLVCSRRHKARTGCSGTRDVTAFVKKSDLNNSGSTLRSDYNFLVNIQRSLHRSSSSLPPSSSPHVTAPEDRRHSGDRKGASLHQALAKSGVKIQRAPQGMKRSRENSTATSDSRRKSRCILWTIEWLMPDGTSKVTNRLNENVSVLDSYLRTFDRPCTAKLASEQGSAAAKKEENSLSTNASDDEKVDVVPKQASIPVTGSPYRFFLKCHSLPNNKPRLRSLRVNDSLKDNLRGSTVLEYPSIYVLGDGDSVSDIGLLLLEDGDDSNTSRFG